MLLLFTYFTSKTICRTIILTIVIFQQCIFYHQQKPELLTILTCMYMMHIRAEKLIPSETMMNAE